MIIEAREDTITLRGAVIKNIWPAIQAAAALLLERHPTGIIIDGSAITECSKKGAETFADAFKYINAHKARIVVTGLSPELVEISKSVPGVRSQLSMAATVEEARSSLELEEVAPRRGKAREAAVIPMLGNWRRAVYLADKLVTGENCEIHLVDLIKVPRTLPIGSPLPERETAGKAWLEEAKTIAKGANITSFSHVERVRSQSAGLLEFINQLKADFTIISVDAKDKNAPKMDDSEALLFTESASFEVSLAKGAPDNPDQPALHPVVPAAGAWEHALEHACKMAYGENVLITVAYIITVPRSEPLNVSKPDIEEAAADCAKEAARIGKKHGVRVETMVERVRDPILGFMKLSEAQKFDLAVIGVKRETSGDYQVAHAIAEALLHDAPFETVFLHVGEKGK